MAGSTSGITNQAGGLAGSFVGGGGLGTVPKYTTGYTSIKDRDAQLAASGGVARNDLPPRMDGGAQGRVTYDGTGMPIVGRMVDDMGDWVPPHLREIHNDMLVREGKAHAY